MIRYMRSLLAMAVLAVAVCIGPSAALGAQGGDASTASAVAASESPAAMAAIPAVASNAAAGPSSASAASAASGADTLAAGSLQAQAEEVAASPSIAYQVYSKGSGWAKKWTKQGKTAGKKSARIQSLKVKLAADGLDGDVLCRAKVYGKGWQSWVSSGQAAGVTGRAVMGVRLKLDGELAEYFDIAYRVYHAEDGWLPWALNGAAAGCRGSLGINQIQIKLVEKGSAPALADGTYLLGNAGNPKAVLATPESTVVEGDRVSRAAYEVDAIGQRFYLRNEGKRTFSLQSVGSGLFLQEKDGAPVLAPYSGDRQQLWKTKGWNGGYLIVNADTGDKLGLSGAKAVCGKKKTRWVLSSTNLIGDGGYTVFNAARENVLAVKGASFAEHANVVLGEFDEEQPSGQTFDISLLSSETYRIDCIGTLKSVGVAGGSTKNGANVRQSSWTRSDAQKWRASLDRAGGLVFTNVASGKVLTARSGGKVGANVVSAKNDSSAVQLWMLETSDYDSNRSLGRAMQKASGLSSSTRYLITVDLTKHWLCVFTGSSGNWKPYKDWQVSTGRSSSPTVTGTFTVGYKQFSFGHGYTCYYATQFYNDYLFHSVLYREGTYSILDGRLGQSISAGCVRMPIERAKWIYNNIPTGTTVRTFW